MKNLRFPIFLSLLLLVCNSCVENVSSVDNEAKPFFDLKSYFESELVRLKQQSGVSKLVTINGQSEKKKLDQIDFREELTFFSRSDINRTAWIDKYQADSLRNGSNEVIGIVYDAISNKMRTKAIYISLNQNKVDSIFIRNEVSGFAASSFQELVYLPAKGYRINNIQHPLFEEERSVQIEVNFL